MKRPAFPNPAPRLHIGNNIRIRFLTAAGLQVIARRIAGIQSKTSLLMYLFQSLDSGRQIHFTGKAIGKAHHGKIPGHRIHRNPYGQRIHRQIFPVLHLIGNPVCHRQHHGHRIVGIPVQRHDPVCHKRSGLEIVGLHRCHIVLIHDFKHIAAVLPHLERRKPFLHGQHFPVSVPQPAVIHNIHGHSQRGKKK